MTRRGSLRLLAGLMAAAAALSGCAHNQAASESLPSTSASASTPALPPLGPKDFPVPARARAKTPDGAIEFIRYYMSLAHEVAVKSLNPKSLLDLSQDCRTCDSIVKSLSKDRAAGYSYKDYSFEFKEYGPGRMSGDTAEIAFVYRQGAVTVLDDHGSIVTARSAAATGKLQSGTHLLWRDDLSSWVITSLTVG